MPADQSPPDHPLPDHPLPDQPLPDRADVVVVGAGPAGTAAALRAAELGAQVVVVEADRVGGVCTNTGCTPVRVLAKTARLVRDARGAGTYGVRLGDVAVDWPAVVRRVEDVVAAVHDVKAVPDRFARAGVQLVHGRAAFADPHTLVVDGDHRLAADRVVLAVGGHSRRLPFPGADLAVLGESVLDLPAVPGRVAIIGSGSTGVQLATVFRAFGAEVALLEVADRILPTGDADLSAALAQAFAQDGITVRTGAGVQRIEALPDGAKALHLDGAGMDQVVVDEVIMCAGWPANVEGLGLAAAGIEVDRGRIAVDEYLRTSVPHVFACGDVNGTAMLVQAAHAEGEAAAINAVLGPSRSSTHGLLPWGGFTDPDIAGVGLTEQEARRRDPQVVTAMVRYDELERPVIDGTTRGFLKVVLDRRRELILGAHAVGEHAVEVVTAVATSMAADVRPATLAMVEYAYPTYSAIIGEACRRAVAA